MQEIHLDARDWTEDLEFYHALLRAVGAPDWHGVGIDALIDSMIWGGINAVEPPYVVRVHNTEAVPQTVKAEIAEVSAALAGARQEFRARKRRNVEVSLEIVPGKAKEEI